MTVFISGGAKCGKSAIAQNIAVRLAAGERLCYVATMIPTGVEDGERIRKHLADRDGMGFETVDQIQVHLRCFRVIHTYTSAIVFVYKICHINIAMSLSMFYLTATEKREHFP